ncbi:hypothetical protein EV426DRAFT_720687 [Tirmania nivea]|nr:hypothetical protein EV426DRAFT_720687 [Tirmania nivea]
MAQQPELLLLPLYNASTSGVADGKGRKWEEIWEDPEWCERLAEVVRRLTMDRLAMDRLAMDRSANDRLARASVLTQ